MRSLDRLLRRLAEARWGPLTEWRLSRYILQKALHERGANPVREKRGGGVVDSAAPAAPQPYETEQELARRIERLTDALLEIIQLCQEYSAPNWYVAQGEIAKAAQHALTDLRLSGANEEAR